MAIVDENRLVAGIELGGTKAVALIARGRDVLATARFPTKAPEVTLEAIARQLEAWRGTHGRFEALGIASFGPVGLDRGRADYGRITSTPKRGWQDVDLVGRFAGRFDVPVGFDTDVAGAAVAEHRWGAGQGAGVLVYLTVGTGVGGGVLVDGRPIHGLIHPELGHIRIRRQPGDDFKGVCPFHGDCLEGLVSGPAIAARTGVKGEELGEGHPVWHRVIGDMAEAIAIFMLTASPQRLLIGGGVFHKRAGLFQALRAGTAERLAGYLAGIGEKELAGIIAPPGLGDMAGPLGAVALAYRA